MGLSSYTPYQFRSLTADSFHGWLLLFVTHWMFALQGSLLATPLVKGPGAQELPRPGSKGCQAMSGSRCITCPVEVFTEPDLPGRPQEVSGVAWQATERQLGRWLGNRKADHQRRAANGLVTTQIEKAKSMGDFAEPRRDGGVNFARIGRQSAASFRERSHLAGSILLVSLMSRASRASRCWRLAREAKKAKRGFAPEKPKAVEVLEAEVEAEVVDRRVVTPVDDMDPEVLSEDMNDLRSAAEGGDVKAMFKFGKALLQGWEEQEANKAQGAQWLLRAAEHGHRPAQSAVGEMFYTGLGLPQDKEQAYKWLKQATGDIGVAGKLTLCSAGDGAPVNKKKAFQYYLAAARSGVSRAMNNLGYMLRFGDGVEEKKEEALEWYLKAAKAGDMDAQYHLGDSWICSSML
eukprot:Skav231627  [mRNA]  locus=scaffold1135:82559:86552:+ [translate_table: standard]